MTNLETLYSSLEGLKKVGLPLTEEQLALADELEEQLIKSEVLPTLSKDIEPSLTKIKRDLVLVVEYHPGEPISVSLSRKANITELIEAKTLTPRSSTLRERRFHRPIIDASGGQRNIALKEKFRRFLATQLSANSAKSYYSTMDCVVREWIRKKVDEHADSVFSYTSSEDVRLCIEILKGSSDFNEENARRHNSMTAALNQYLLFIQEWEKLNREV